MGINNIKTIEQIDAEITEYNDLRDYIKLWFDDYQKELKKKEVDFVMEITKENPEWTKEKRVEYLQDKFESLNEKYIKIFNKSQELKNMPTKTNESWFIDEVVSILKNHLEGIIKEIKRIKFENEMWNNPMRLIENNGGVTEEEIETARNVDWEIIVSESRPNGGNKKITTCLWHDDKHPSLVLYENGKGGYCFSCNKACDTIEYFMKKFNIKFIEAVKNLNNL